MKCVSAVVVAIATPLFGHFARAALTNSIRHSRQAIKEYGYQGVYRGVYPLGESGTQSCRRGGTVWQPLSSWSGGGSKPELLAVLAMLDDAEALIYL